MRWQACDKRLRARTKEYQKCINQRQSHLDTSTASIRICRNSYDHRDCRSYVVAAVIAARLLSLSKRERLLQEIQTSIGEKRRGRGLGKSVAEL